MCVYMLAHVWSLWFSPPSVPEMVERHRGVANFFPSFPPLLVSVILWKVPKWTENSRVHGLKRSRCLSHHASFPGEAVFPLWASVSPSLKMELFPLWGCAFPEMGGDLPTGTWSAPPCLRTFAHIGPSAQNSFFFSLFPSYLILSPGRNLPWPTHRKSSSLFVSL